MSIECFCIKHGTYVEVWNFNFVWLHITTSVKAVNRICRKINMKGKKKESVLGIHYRRRSVYTKKLETNWNCSFISIVTHAIQTNPSIIVINCHQNHHHEEKNTLKNWIISFFEVFLSWVKNQVEYSMSWNIRL